MNTFLRYLFPLLSLPVAVFAVSFPAKTSADADLVFSIQSTSELVERLESHPLALVASNPKWSFLFDLASEKLGGGSEELFADFEATLVDDFNLSVDEFFELFSGRVSLSFYGLTDMLTGQSEGSEFILLADFDGSREQLYELMEIQFERNAKAHREFKPEVKHELLETSFMGEALFLDEVFDGELRYIEDGFALVDGIFILATPEARLQSAVEAVKEAGGSSLEELEGYVALRENSEMGDMSLFVNLDSLLDPLVPKLHDLVGRSGLAMAGVTGQSLEAALSLEDLQAYSIDVSFSEDGLVLDSGLIYREKSGLTRLLTYEAGGLPEAGFVPQTAFSSSLVRWNLSEMFGELEDMLKVMSPALAPIIDIQIQNLKNSTGVDLRRTILENFGSEMVTFSLIPQRADSVDNVFNQEQLMVFEIEDSAALSQTIEALLDAMPNARAAFEIKDFAGESIYTVYPGAVDSVGGIPSNGISFSVTRNHFMLHQGRVSVLQEAIAAMQNGREGFWQMPSNIELFDALGVDEPVARYYVDLGQLIRPVLIPMLEAMKLSGIEVPDLSGLPDQADFPYVLISESYEVPEGVFTRVAVVSKGGDQ